MSQPKDPGRRVNRVQPVRGWTEIPDVPYAGPKPRLPTGTPAASARWWRAISTMPHCVLWAPSDWQFALDTLPVHEAVMSGELRYLGELRAREKQMLTTHKARDAAKIRYVEPEAIAGEPVATSSMSPDDEDRWRALLGDDEDGEA